MADIEVETGIVITEQPRARLGHWPFARTPIGCSFVVPLDTDPDAYRRMRLQARIWKKRRGWEFKFGYDDQGQYRCKRIA